MPGPPSTPDPANDNPRWASDGTTNHVILNEASHARQFERINVLINVVYSLAADGSVDQYWWNVTPDRSYLVTSSTNTAWPTGILWMIRTCRIDETLPLNPTTPVQWVGTTGIHLDGVSDPALQPIPGSDPSLGFQGDYVHSYWLPLSRIYEIPTVGGKLRYTVNLQIGSSTISFDPELELGADQD